MKIRPRLKYKELAEATLRSMRQHGTYHGPLSEQEKQIADKMVDLQKTAAEDVLGILKDMMERV